MVFRITGGIWLLLMGLEQTGILSVPVLALGVLGLVAGIALLAGK